MHSYPDELQVQDTKVKLSRHVTGFAEQKQGVILH
ncbi:hypothetical protein C7448_11072 [Tenacibaculum gallaicum]|uniref:Uncharacterized protein n=1 Tax=Tenacibaculum gallaicum TaxID=561505 RepID=A0A3E0HH32_9FLAO|nr:hypothetical protein C7448_11072 [Tenacibaculum gallaicum]